MVEIRLLRLRRDCWHKYAISNWDKTLLDCDARLLWIIVRLSQALSDLYSTPSDRDTALSDYSSILLDSMRLGYDSVGLSRIAMRLSQTLSDLDSTPLDYSLILLDSLGLRYDYLRLSRI